MQLDNDLLDLWLLKAPTQEQMRALIEECQRLRGPGNPRIRELEKQIEDLGREIDDLEDEITDLRSEDA